MAVLRDIPANAVLLGVFRKFPATSRPLIQWHEVLMRGESPLTAGECELIAAYVSGLNSCAYCHGVHTMTAETFGIAEGTLEARSENVDMAPVDGKIKPLLNSVKKLTHLPAKFTSADADTVYAAGWDGRALHDAISVCAVFNFMNRLVEGIGITAIHEHFRVSGERLHRGSYSGLLRLPDE